jgi:hypothetical protein
MNPLQFVLVSGVVFGTTVGLAIAMSGGVAGPAAPAFIPQCEGVPVENVEEPDWRSIPADKPPVEYMIEQCLEPLTEAQDAVIKVLDGLQAKPPQPPPPKNPLEPYVPPIAADTAAAKGKIDDMVGGLKEIAGGWELYMAKCIAKGFAKSLGGTYSIHANVQDFQKTAEEVRKMSESTPGPGSDLEKRQPAALLAKVKKLVDDTTTSIKTIQGWASAVTNLAATDLLPDVVTISMPLDAAKTHVQNLGTECKVKDADSALVAAQTAGKTVLLAARVQLAKRRGERIRQGLRIHSTDHAPRANDPTWQRLRAEENEAADRVGSVERALNESAMLCSQLRVRAPHVNQLQVNIDQKRDDVANAIAVCDLGKADNLLLELRTLQSDPCANVLPPRSPAFEQFVAEIRTKREKGCSVKLLQFGVDPKMSLVKPGDTVAPRAYAVYADAPAKSVDVTDKVEWSGERKPPFAVAAGDAGKTFAMTAKLNTVSDVASASVVTKEEEKQETHGPFAVSLSEWTRTGVNLKPGDSITVKAGGVFRNERGEVSGGADGWGGWGWFVMIAKLDDKQAQYVGSSGGMTATTEGMVELGMPRGMGGKFLLEDAQNYSGGVTVYVFVHRKTGP